jgi:WD40 repeat protein
MGTLSKWIYPGLVTLLVLSACSAVRPVSVGDQTLTEETDQFLVDETDRTSAAGATTANSIQATPKKILPATPDSAQILAHPQECSPAPLPQSVLMYNWSERQREHLLFPLDATTGQPLCAYEPISLGYQFLHAFSPDGNMLAVTISQREDGEDSALHWIDLKNWQVSKTPVEFEKWVVSIAFSPDGHKLAIAAAGAPSRQSGTPNSNQIVVVDSASRTVQAETSVSFIPNLLAFSNDGSAVVVYGSTDNPGEQAYGTAQVVLLDSTTLESQWETSLAEVIHGGVPSEEVDDYPEGFEIWEPAIVFDHEQGALYLVHADADRLTSVDLIKRTTRSVNIQPPTSMLERLLALTAGVAHAKTLDGYFKTAVLSPDGTRLYVLGRTADSYQDADGNWQFSETPHGLKVIAIATGAEITHLATEATELALSDDGRSLFLSSWNDQGWTEVVDAITLDTKTRLPGRQLNPGRRLDGQPVLLSTTYHQNGQTSLAIVDRGSFKDIYKGFTTQWASWLLER